MIGESKDPLSECASSSSADLVLRNATVVDVDGLRPGLDIEVRGSEILRVGTRTLTAQSPATIVDCRGAVVVPAFANVHHHFATGLLRGAPAPSVPTRNQKERLERVIWPFERRLSHRDIRAAVRSGLLEATAAGTAAVIDHHVSSSCIPGVLDVIAEEVEASGLRAILCYEVTDRDGDAVAKAGLTETGRFLLAVGSGGNQLAGMVGLHAMATVGPETLARAVDLAVQFDTGLHLHLGEAANDNEDSVAHFGARPVARLAIGGGLTPRTLAAHAVHITDTEAALLGKKDVLVAHNPRSNASNGVGITDLTRLAGVGCTIGLGGDGFTQDIRGDFALTALLQRHERRDPTLLPPQSVVDIGIDGNASILQRLAGWQTGRIAPGYQADIVMLDYQPVVPLLPDNVHWHQAAGFPGATVNGMWVGGSPILRNGSFERLDAERIRHETSQRFNALWGRDSSTYGLHGIVTTPTDSGTL
jgi:cytosine/adenosine deaminase-related metal-dependent hydrolase